jgi:hypothetical protein
MSQLFQPRHRDGLGDPEEANHLEPVEPLRP